MSNLIRTEKNTVRLGRWTLKAIATIFVGVQISVLFYSSQSQVIQKSKYDSSRMFSVANLKTMNQQHNLPFNATDFQSTSFVVATNTDISNTSQMPLFVLHVGPPKTGTTSLQHVLSAYQNILLEDSYHYLGDAKLLGGDFTRCLNKLERNHKKGDRLCWELFIELLEYHRKLGNNIILSNEVFGLHTRRPFAWNLLHDYLGHWPLVEIVVSYRHLHNFMPSAHFELQKNLRWPGPPEHGKFVTPITKFWRRDCSRSNIGAVPTPGAVIARFGAHYKVKVLNIESHDQISYFLCSILEGANRTCAYHSTNSSFVPPALNQRSDGQLNYDALALMAWKNKLLKNEQTRRYLRDKIKYHQEVTLKKDPNDFPLDCLTLNQEQRLLEESLQHARDCGLDTTGELDTNLRLDFAKAKAAHKFCSINATLAFADTNWQAFFAEAKTVW